VGGGHDQSRVHPAARSHPEIRIKLQQARPRKWAHAFNAG
jgi:hypothetical protein